MAEIFQLGNMIGAFARPRAPKPTFKSNELKDRYTYTLMPYWDEATKANRSNVEDYSAAVRAGTPEAQRFANLDKEAIGGLIDKYLAYDPSNTYNAIRDANLASLDNQFTNLVDYGSATDKARMASLGLGGRASAGAYGKIQDSIRAARNLSPVLAQIYGNLGSDFSRVSGDRYANLLNSLNLMNQRAGLQDARVANRSLMPIDVRNAAFATDAANLGTIQDLYDQNVSGYMADKSGLERWADFGRSIDNSLNSVVDTALSLYGGGMLGGGGAAGSSGGSGGGIMGLFGGGNRSGGGSMDIGQIMQILNALGYGRSTQPSYSAPAYSWNPMLG